MGIVYGPKWPFYSCCDYIGLLGTGFIQVLYLGRAPRTKETLPDFLKWRRVTQHPLVFRGLTGSQQTPGFWGVTYLARSDLSAMDEVSEKKLRGHETLRMTYYAYCDE